MKDTDVKELVDLYNSILQNQMHYEYTKYDEKPTEYWEGVRDGQMKMNDFLLPFLKKIIDNYPEQAKEAYDLEMSRKLIKTFNDYMQKRTEVPQI